MAEIFSNYRSNSSLRYWSLCCCRCSCSRRSHRKGTLDFSPLLFSRCCWGRLIFPHDNYLFECSFSFKAEMRCWFAWRAIRDWMEGGRRSYLHDGTCWASFPRTCLPSTMNISLDIEGLGSREETDWSTRLTLRCSATCDQILTLQKFANVFM